MAWHVMHVCDVFDVKTVQLALPVQLLLLVAHKGRPLQPARRGRGAGSGVGGVVIAWAADCFDVKTSDVWGVLALRGHHANIGEGPLYQ